MREREANSKKEKVTQEVFGMKDRLTISARVITHLFLLTPRLYVRL